MQVGHANLDVQHYRLTRAELRLPQHVTTGARRPELELVLTHTWSNATNITKAVREMHKEWLSEHPEQRDRKEASRNTTEVDRRIEDAVARQRMWMRSAAGDQLAAAEKRLDTTLEKVQASRASLSRHSLTLLRQAQHEAQRSIRQLRLTATRAKTLSGSDQAVERETLQAAIKSFTNASSVWDQAWGLQALQTLPAALRSREPAVSSTDALRKDVADGLAALASLLPYAA